MLRFIYLDNNDVCRHTPDPRIQVDANFITENPKKIHVVFSYIGFILQVLSQI